MSAAEFHFEPIEQIAFGCALDLHTECIYRLEGYIHETYRNRGREAEKIWTFHLKDGRPAGLISNSSAEDLREIIGKERKSKAYHTMANEFHFEPIEPLLAGASLNRQLESVYRLDGYFHERWGDEGSSGTLKNWWLTKASGQKIEGMIRCTVEDMREWIQTEWGDR